MSNCVQMMNTLAFISYLGSPVAQPFQLYMAAGKNRFSRSISLDSDSRELCTQRELAEVDVLPKAFVMCKAKFTAHWNLVTWGCTLECKSSAEWGGNSAKGDSSLNILHFRNVCNRGSKFKDSRKGGKGKMETKIRKSGRKDKKKSCKIPFLDNIQLIRCKNISEY